MGRLPPTPRHHAPGRRPATTPDAPAPGSPRVLLASGDSLLVAVLRHGLAGHPGDPAVGAAASLPAALEALAGTPAWEVVVLDPALPGAGGSNPLAALRAAAPEAAFVMIGPAAGAAEAHLTRSCLAPEAVAGAVDAALCRCPATPAEGSLEGLFAHAPFAIEAYDLEGNLIALNDAARALFGIGAGLPVYNLFSSPFAPPDLKESLRRGRPWRSELVFEPAAAAFESRARGPVWTDAAVFPAFDEQGAPTGFFALYNDMTERRHLAARLQSVREEEGARLAREIHDELGSGLTGLRLDLAWLADRSRGETRSRLARMDSQLESLLAALRRVARELHPAVVDDLGLAAALSWLAEGFAERTGLPCTTALDPGLDELDKTRAAAVYRIVQEALTNAARHARGATEVAISAQRKGAGWRVEVRDDGPGIPPDRKRGLGLAGMRERAAFLGGALKFPRPSRGTVVRVDFPAAFRLPL
ncbi:hypothetical protein IIA16_04770 [bacterium]|nr:hypothetical protein [bacterium]